MKIKFCTALAFCMIGLLGASSVQASSTDMINSIPKQVISMEERNAAIADYIRENIDAGRSTIDHSQFFKEHPEYVISETDTVDDVELVDSVSLPIDEVVTYNSRNDSVIEKDVEVDFYSNGSYVVSTLESEKKPLNLLSLNLNSFNGELKPSQGVTGKNTHEIYNHIGQYAGRTYIEASFVYDGRIVGGNVDRYNLRMFAPNVYYAEASPSVGYLSFPSEYNGTICRASYDTYWYKNQLTGNSTYAGFDFNRVSCNNKGKVFRSEPNKISW